MTELAGQEGSPLETYTEAKKLVENLQYQEQKETCMDSLSDSMIDRPIVGIVSDLNRLPWCFTLQSCYGHFLHRDQTDPHGLEPLPGTDTIVTVEYRIAYVAFCIDDSMMGSKLLEDLKGIAALDTQNMQLCSADWFWERQVNSYALQVEPDRFKSKDRATLSYREALHVAGVRDDFFKQLGEYLEAQGDNPANRSTV